MSNIETKHKAMIEEFVDKTARLKLLMTEMFEANVVFPTIAQNSALVAQQHSRKMLRAAIQVLDSASAVFKIDLAPVGPRSSKELERLNEIKIESPRPKKRKVPKPVKAKRFEKLEFD